eukprot:jgi/Bigna1/89334/estExt_fgenesh1_pg.C_470088
MVLVSTPNDFRQSYFPLAGAMIGSILTLLGGRFPRLWNSIVGCGVGWAGMMWFVSFDTTWDQVPIVLSLLGSVVGALLALVMGPTCSGITIGYCAAILVILLTNEQVFTINTFDEAAIFIIVMCMAGLVYSLYRPKSSLLFGSTISGALLSTTCIDVYGSQNFYRISTMFTIFKSPGVRLPRTCDMSCFYMMIFWGLLSILGVAVQSLSLYLAPVEEDEYESIPEAQGAVWAPMGNRSNQSNLTREEQSFANFNSFGASSSSGELGKGEATHNYLSQDDMPATMRSLSTKLSAQFNKLQKQFGFQLSNKRNQHEHLVMLISNAMSRIQLEADLDPSQELTMEEIETLAMKRVHDKLYENYLKWCLHLERTEVYTRSQGSPEGRVLMENMALIMMIWGEAATMRHVPESLCYITHNMLRELRTKRVSYNREPGSFLAYVIRPMYNVLRSDNRDIYTKRRNYDDINEFFWTQQCFDYSYCEAEYAPGTNDGDSKEAERSIAVGLSNAEKTYIETRSWWHLVTTFYPLILFYVVSFHFLVCLAWVLHRDAKGLHNHTLSNVTMVSFVVTMSIALLVREFLELYIRKGKDLPNYSRSGSIFRICVKLTFALAISFYYYRMLFCTGDQCSDAWLKYSVISCAFLLPLAGQILTLMFPIAARWGNQLLTSRSCLWITKLWWPNMEQYIGRDTSESDGDYFQYQLFWVLLLAWKMLISYNFQVVPCINPTLWIWGQVHFFSLPTRIACIVVTWVPFFIVYMFDMYIWYAVWQGLAGLVVGMRNRVGQIHQFSLVPALFSDFPAEMGEKLFQTRKPEPLMQPNLSIADKGGKPNDFADGLQLESTTLTSYGSIEDDEIVSKMHQNRERFRVIWNEMIYDLRATDLMSNSEQFVFEFRQIEFGKLSTFQTPLFVSTSSINASLQFVAATAAAFKNSIVGREEEQHLDSKSAAVIASFIEYFSQTTRRESVSDLWNLAITLVRALTPSKAHEALGVFQNIIEGMAYPRRDNPYTVLFRNIHLQKVAGLKPKLLMLVRGARLARAAWKKYRKNKRTPSSNHSAASRSYSSNSPSKGGKYLSVSSSSTSGSDIHKSPSLGTLKLKEKLDQDQNFYPSTRRKKYHPDVEKHMALLKDQLRALLKSIVGLLCQKQEPARQLDTHLEEVVGFVDERFGSSDEHMRQLDDFLLSPMCDVILNSLYTFLTVSNEFVPQNTSARRRILFFCNSLFMDIPGAPPIEQMHSLSTLTPFYSEDVLYSKAYLQNKTAQGFSVLLYLQTVYPSEWQNFCERMGIKTGDASILEWGSQELQMEVRLWATRRGQTLFRTVEGMMMYEKAVRVLAELETLPGIATDIKNTMEGKGLSSNQANSPNSDEKTTSSAHRTPSSDVLACLKYQYVVSCQVYGRQKEENDPKAKDIEFLLHKFPNLRVAYIDNKKEEGKGGELKSKYYSCLIKAAPRKDAATDDLSSPMMSEEKPTSTRSSSTIARKNAEADDEWNDDGDDGQGSGGIETVYRVELPGNPIIGEGKPENQNHAIIFTRGEFVQAIDMNQEGYFEEAVKMRNLMEEFDKRDSRKPTTIVGFREHIFTGGLSSIANYMAMQEGCFVSLGQRVLHDPLKIRLHYGHPDLFDKLFYMTRGGVSKASKGINLSEDIFAGFNTVLRGGHVSFKEYIQCGKGRDVGLQQLYKFEGKLSCGNAMQSLTRDMYRICRSVDFLKLMSFFYGGIGFYISTLLAVWGLYAFCYQRVLIAALNLSLPKSFIGIYTVGYWIGTMGILLTLPIICSIGLERGSWKAICKVLYMLISGGPLFFMFHMGTKAHYFARTILSGGAKYRPTGRGFVADHTKFAELFRFYSHSHFQGAVEMVLLLILYGIFDRRVKHYWAVTWCAWVIVLSWLSAPIWLNPMTFDWEQVVSDTKDFMKWMGRPEGGSDRCWRTWWVEENNFVDPLPFSSKMLCAILSLRHSVSALCIFWYSGVGLMSPTVWGCAGFMVMIVGYYSLANRPVAASQLCFVRGLKSLYVTVTFALFVILLVISPPTKHTIKKTLLVFIAIVYLLCTFSSFSLSFGYRFGAVQALSRLYDYIIGLTLLGFVAFGSLLVVPSWIQTRLLFHNAFSKGVLIDDLLRGGGNQKQQQQQQSVEVKTSSLQQEQQMMMALTKQRGPSPAGRHSYQKAVSSRKSSSASIKTKKGPGGGPANMPVDTSFISKAS